MRSLLWKEWRGQRLVLLGGVVFVAVAPLLLSAFRSLRTSRTEFLADSVLWLALASPQVVWPLVALAAGVIATTAEVGGERWALLLSRPVSRARIWVAKVLAALAPVLMLVALNELVLWLLMPAQPPALPGWSGAGLVAGLGARVDALAVLGVPGITSLGLSLGLLFGLLLQRQLHAALAGALVGGGMTIALVWVRAGLDHLPRIESYQLTIDTALLGGAIGIASLLALRRGELMSGRRFLWRGIGAATVLTVLATALIGAHLAWDARGPGKDALLGDLRAAGGRVVVSAARGEGAWSQTVFSAGADDERLRPIAPRLSRLGVPSSDGKRVYFVSDGVPWNGTAAGALRGDRSSLHAYYVDEANTELLAWTDLLPWEQAPPPSPSPDNRWVAVEGRRIAPVTVVAGIGNGRLPVAVRPCGSFRWAFWDSEPNHLVHTCFPEQGTLLRWLDPATGKTTFEQSVDLPAISEPQPSSDPDRVAFRGPLARPREAKRLHLLDLRTRSLRTIEPAPGFEVVDAAVAPGVVAWIEQESWSAGLDEPERAARMMLLRGESEVPETFVETTGVFLSLSLDPAGEWLVIGRYGRGESIVGADRDRALRRTAISLVDGRHVDLGPATGIVTSLGGNTAWAGPAKLALLEEPSSPSMIRSNQWFRTLRIVDLETGEERVLRP